MDLCPFGRASAVMPASWERTSDFRNYFQNPAIASQSRGFCFLTQNQNERKKHEEKQNIGADGIQP
jgi:hypothetical protein